MHLSLTCTPDLDMGFLMAFSTLTFLQLHITDVSWDELSDILWGLAGHRKLYPISESDSVENPEKCASRRTPNGETEFGVLPPRI
jgi:hypothetical protein